MKKLASILVLAALFSCSKKDWTGAKSVTNYLIRVVAVDNDGVESFTSISRVKSGKVVVEFETSEAVNVKEYKVEASSDGSHFTSIKTIAADIKLPDKIYRDTLELQ
ncbi:hypothetical protein [Flavisolibacter ginsenosidimutans]|uniref:Uncharacterized protein n=1 Tax=Flavisolibacter ginsenosidimutans TaxID=661481 RepID=A0A5B8UN39_9BACT|nr:hypothetical protein [Flavisolibacter ginsenosidimutans]QEC57629.1 hypothetical protein FSB75_17540 [Flavisolibacter ginsenosidimutans]